MRAPDKTFRSEIMAYRHRLALTKQDGTKGTLISEVLDRWERRADVEQIWEKIERASPAKNLPPPALFIARVLSSCNWSDALSGVVREAPAVKERAESRALRHAREKQFHEAGEIYTALGDVIENSKVLTR